MSDAAGFRTAAADAFADASAAHTSDGATHDLLRALTCAVLSLSEEQRTANLIAYADASEDRLLEVGADAHRAIRRRLDLPTSDSDDD